MTRKGVAGSCSMARAYASAKTATKRSDETKRKLSSAFKKLLIASAYEPIDVSAITRESGISRKSFYYHFSCKDDLVAYILESDMRRIEERVSTTLKGWEALLTLCRLLYIEHRFYRAITIPENQIGIYMKMRLVLTPFLRKTTCEILGLPEGHECCLLAADSMMDAIVRWISSEAPSGPTDFLINFRNQMILLAEAWLMHFRNIAPSHVHIS